MHDGQEIAETLKSLGYKIYNDGPISNASSNSEIYAHIKRYASSVPDGSVSILYFSGHGGTAVNQSDNYLFPSNLDIDAGDSVENNAVSVRTIVGIMKEHNSVGENILFLDACRDNDLDNLVAVRGMQKLDSSIQGQLNLSRLKVFIGYGAEFGTYAWEAVGDVKTSIYTTELIKNMKKHSNISLNSLHVKVINDVEKKTRGKEYYQVPAQDGFTDACIGKCKSTINPWILVGGGLITAWALIGAGDGDGDESPSTIPIELPPP